MAPDTVDHVPSKVFLDDSLPENVPVVPACQTCNGSFSRDEEYLACFLECVVTGTADPDRLRRPKIARAMRHSPSLATLIAATCAGSNGQLALPHVDLAVRAAERRGVEGHRIRACGQPARRVRAAEYCGSELR